jgi:hypothetical protein
MVSNRPRRLVCGVALAALLAAGTPAARAQEMAPGTPDGLTTTLRYMGCAAGMAWARTPGAVTAAILNCVKIIAEEWKKAF